MSEQEFNEIEVRLRAMQPKHPGDAVKQRIATSIGNHLSADLSPAPLRFRRVWLAGLIAAVVALAGLLGVIVQFTQKSASAPKDNPSYITQWHTGPYLNAAPQPEPVAPTVIAFNAALRESPHELDNLLDQLCSFHPARLSSDAAPIPTVASARQWLAKEQLP